MSSQHNGEAGRKRDPLLFNKIAGGVLSAGLVLWIGVHIADFLTASKAPPKPVVAAASTAPAAAAAIPSINGLILKADVKKGAAFVQQQCSACHSVNQGGANGVGPNLYGVMGAPMFAHAGYHFSSAVEKVAKGNWGYQKMNEWLLDPQTFASGTRMGYPGIKNDVQRADVIAYLRTLSANPIPLPSATASVASAAPAASVGDGAPSIKPLYASAVISKGQSFFEQQCSACHSINKGGAAGVGPNLYGVLQGPMFAHPGYSFSGAVKKIAAGNWTPHKMNDWLYNPMKDAPGTRMGYPGIKNNQVRADVIAYLNAQSDKPDTLK
ncbi:cytochrome c [Acidiphilium sp. MT5]